MQLHNLLRKYVEPTEKATIKSKQHGGLQIDSKLKNKNWVNI